MRMARTDSCWVSSGTFSSGGKGNALSRTSAVSIIGFLSADDRSMDSRFSGPGFSISRETSRGLGFSALGGESDGSEV